MIIGRIIESNINRTLVTVFRMTDDSYGENKTIFTGSTHVVYSYILCFVFIGSLGNIASSRQYKSKWKYCRLFLFIWLFVFTFVVENKKDSNCRRTLCLEHYLGTPLIQSNDLHIHTIYTHTCIYLYIYIFVYVRMNI